MTDRTVPFFATVIDALFAHADARAEGLAFAVDDDRITFGALRDDACALAGAMAARGVGPGDRCALVMGTAIDTIRTIFAVQIAGAAPVIINPAQPAATIRRRVEMMRPILSIGDEDGTIASDGLSLDDLRREDRPGWRPARLPAPADTAYLQITSGTAGEPKAAILSHRSLAACLRGLMARHEIRIDDVFVSWMPLHHDMGLVRFTFFPCFAGCPAYLIAPAVSNFQKWLEIVGEASATITGSPDFGYRISGKLVDPGGVDLSSLRSATNGGEPVRASTIRDFEQRFACPGVIRPGYGLAEATLGVASVRPGQELRVDASGCVSCGSVFAGLDIAIQGEDGESCSVGEVGEILVRGDAVFEGYLDDPAMTAEMLRDGWLHTGDMGYLDDDGELFVLGRKRALIKRAGAVVLPREIEEAVDRVEGVRFCAVIGHVRDQGSGDEEVVVVAEVRPEAAANDDARERIARDVEAATSAAVGFIPRDVVLVRPRAIPRTRNGKIRHAELKRVYAEDLFRGEGAALFSTRR